MKSGGGAPYTFLAWCCHSGTAPGDAGCCGRLCPWEMPSLETRGCSKAVLWHGTSSPSPLGGWERGALLYPSLFPTPKSEPCMGEAMWFAHYRSSWQLPATLSACSCPPFLLLAAPQHQQPLVLGDVTPGQHLWGCLSHLLKPSKQRNVVLASHFICLGFLFHPLCL